MSVTPELTTIAKSMDGGEEQYPVGGFTTIHMAKQAYGEVDPDFLKSHGSGLGSKWKFKRPDGKYKMVSFEGHATYPILCLGWPELREFYDMKLENETMHIGYYGEGVFELLATEYKDNTEDYPSFHSRCNNKGTTICFDLKLRGISAQKSKLKLSGRLGDYVRGHGMDQVKLCSDNLIFTLFDVYYKDSPSNSTKIGIRWKQFCECNNFREGDTLRFRYVYVGRQSMFRVFKL